VGVPDQGIWMRATLSTCFGNNPATSADLYPRGNPQLNEASQAPTAELGIRVFDIEPGHVYYLNKSTSSFESNSAS